MSQPRPEVSAAMHAAIADARTRRKAAAAERRPARMTTTPAVVTTREAKATNHTEETL